MKRFFLLLFLIGLGFILLHRERVFLRDPLAHVDIRGPQSGSEAVREGGVQVYINYSNDVLLWKESSPGYMLLVQHSNKTPGSPVQIHCMHWMACMTDAVEARILPLQPAGSYDPKVQMSNTEVDFTNPQGQRFEVHLR
jgi:hypothetical protein